MVPTEHMKNITLLIYFLAISFADHRRGGGGSGGGRCGLLMLRGGLSDHMQHLKKTEKVLILNQYLS